MLEIKSLASRLRPTPALAVSLTALAVASTGVAIGAIPSEDGTIHACYTQGAPLKVVDVTTSCPAGESRLSWNQRGPAGPAGIKESWFAPSRPPGHQVTINSRKTFVRLRSLDLPAGSYAVDARSNLRLKDGVENLSGSSRGPANIRAAIADCRLRARVTADSKAATDLEYATAITHTRARAFNVNGEVYRQGDDMHTASYTERNEVPMALHTMVSLPQPTTVTFECRVDYGGTEGQPRVRPSITASVFSMRALQVDKVNVAY